jgi:predicted dehydrogenase
MIPIVIIGCRWGLSVARELASISDSGFRIAGVCDLDADLARRVGEQLAVPVWPDIDSVLADDSIPAVALITQPSGRAGLLRKMVRMGKHVMTTKPFELDPVAAADVLREARERKRVICVNSPAPTHPPNLQVIRAWQQQHDLGRPILFSAEIHASYQERPTGTWHDKPALCPAAPVFRIGIYLIHDLLALLGEFEDVRVLTSRIRTGRPTPDAAVLAIKFRNGCTGSVAAAFCINDGRPYRDSFTIHFERGSVFHNAGPQIAATGVISESTLVVAGASGPVIHEQHHLTRDPHAYPWQEFAALIRTGTPLPQDCATVIVEGVRLVERMAREESGQMP